MHSLWVLKQGRSQPLTPGWARYESLIFSLVFDCFSHFSSIILHNFLIILVLRVDGMPTLDGPGYASVSELSTWKVAFKCYLSNRQSICQGRADKLILSRWVEGGIFLYMSNVQLLDALCQVHYKSRLYVTGSWLMKKSQRSEWQPHPAPKMTKWQP